MDDKTFDKLRTVIKEEVRSVVKEEVRIIVREEVKVVVREEIEQALVPIKSTLDGHTAILDEHTGILDKHTAILDEHTAILNKHTGILNKHTQILGEHSQKIDALTAEVFEMHTEIGAASDRALIYYESNKRNLNEIRDKLGMEKVPGLTPASDYPNP